jgi:hypothetical protein
MPDTDNQTFFITNETDGRIFEIFGDLVLRSWKERGKVYLLMETGRG